MPWEAVNATFAPTGATAQYPLPADVASAISVATRPLTGVGDGLSISGFWDKDTPTTRKDMQKGVDGGLSAWRKNNARKEEEEGQVQLDSKWPRRIGDEEPELEGIASYKVTFFYVKDHELRDFEEGVLKNRPDLYNGEMLQDKWVMDIFSSKRSGFYIDLASNDAVLTSNTITLERLGWEGLCIEPAMIHVVGLTHRTCKIVQAVVSDKTGDLVKFIHHYTDEKGNECGHWCARVADSTVDPEPPKGSWSTYRTVTFAKIISDFQVPQVIDYISLDVETYESKVMSTFPWKTHTIMSMSVEFPGEDLAQLLIDNGLMPVKIVGSDLLFINVKHPEFDDVMQRHYNGSLLKHYAFLKGASDL